MAALELEPQPHLVFQCARLTGSRAREAWGGPGARRATVGSRLECWMTPAVRLPMAGDAALAGLLAYTVLLHAVENP